MILDVDSDTCVGIGLDDVGDSVDVDKWDKGLQTLDVHQNQSFHGLKIQGTALPHF